MHGLWDAERTPAAVKPPRSTTCTKSKKSFKSSMRGVIVQWAGRCVRFVATSHPRI
jgi:hypothetical protein